VDPHAGVRAAVELELPEASRTAAAFEVLADRYDVLR
jgi:hypothetical protein